MKKISLLIIICVFSVHLFAQNKVPNLVEYYNQNKEDIGKIEQKLFDTLKDYCDGNEKSFRDFFNTLPNDEELINGENTRLLPLSPTTFIQVNFSKEKIALLCYISNEDYLKAYIHHLYEYKKFAYSFGTANIENDKGLLERKDTKIAAIDSDWIINNYRIRYTDAFCELADGTIDTTGPVIIVETKDKSPDLQPLIPLKFECTKSVYIENGVKTNIDIDEPIHKFIVDFNQMTLYNSDFQYIASITKYNDSEIICAGKNGDVVYTYKIDRQLGTYTSHSEIVNKTPKVELIDSGTVTLITKSLF